MEQTNNEPKNWKRKEEVKKWLIETGTDLTDYYDYIKRTPKSVLIELGDIDESESIDDLLNLLEEMITESPLTANGE